MEGAVVARFFTAEARGALKMSGNTAVEIRPLAPEELALVERHIAFDWGAPAKHRERLARQGEGEVAYLIAWNHEYPIGHVLLVWGGTIDEPVRTRLADCADLQDLFVAPEYRRLGVGARLLEKAEALATQRGFSRLGLGAALDNPGAQRLYQRSGYLDSGFGEYLSGGVYIDRDGSAKGWEEICIYLIKWLEKESLG